MSVFLRVVQDSAQFSQDDADVVLEYRRVMVFSSVTVLP